MLKSSGFRKGVYRNCVNGNRRAHMSIHLLVHLLICLFASARRNIDHIAAGSLRSVCSQILAAFRRPPCPFKNLRALTGQSHMHTYIYIYIYILVYMFYCAELPEHRQTKVSAMSDLLLRCPIPPNYPKPTESKQIQIICPPALGKVKLFTLADLRANNTVSPRKSEDNGTRIGRFWDPKY